MRDFEPPKPPQQNFDLTLPPPSDGVARAMKMIDAHAQRERYAEMSRLEAEGQVLMNMGFTRDELTILYQPPLRPEVMPRMVCDA